MKFFQTLLFIALSIAVSIAVPCFGFAQTPAEHAKHHPQPQTSTAPDSAASMGGGMGAKDSGTAKPGGMDGGGGMMSGGMGAGMGEMMKGMGKSPEKELFPSLMQLPDITPEKREKIRQLAEAQVVEGNALLNMGMDELKGATRNQDMSAMQHATEQMRRGRILLESGLEGRQALAENKDPRLTALQWFNREMQLTPPTNNQSHGFFGLSLFHLLSMVTFVVFAVLMIWMYFYKMQRANALVAKLAGNTSQNTPPPAGATPVAAAKPNVPPTSNAVSSTPTSATAPAGVNPEIAPSKSNAWTGTMVVAEIFDETPKVKTFRLTDPAGGKLPFNYLPGQFLTVTVIPKGVPIKRSYTIASSPTHRDYCEITIKNEEQGAVSHYLNTFFHLGELLQLTAPSGKFTFIESEADSLVLIAGGVGVTPLMSTIRYLTDRSWKKDIYLFFACKDESSIIFKEEIEYLQKRYSNLHIIILLSRPKGKIKDAYIEGHITKEIITEHVPEITKRRIHICGPPSLIDAVKQMLDELKVPKENVRVEQFASQQKPNTPTLPTPQEGANPDLPVEAAPAAAGTGVVTFAKSNKTAVLTPDKSVLEASEEVGVNIDYSCRVGTCGICKTKLISGKVTMAVEDALTPEDKTQNIILACQAKATEPISVDA